MSSPEVKKTEKFTGNRKEKEEHVKKTYEGMVKNYEKISVRKIMAKSGISQRIVVEVLKTIPLYVPNKMN